MIGRSLPEKLVRFAMVGGTATMIQYVILGILVEAAGFRPATASTIGFSISAVANYFLNRTFTFASTSTHRVAATRFATTVVIGLVLNFASMFVLTYLGTNYVIAQIMTTFAVLALNFTLGNWWTFK